MKLTLSVLVLVSSLAFAGKEDREFMKNEMTPALTKAEEAVKKACGCGMKLTLAKTVATRADLNQVKYIVEDVASGATKYCADAESKAAVCKMKSLELAKGTESGFKFAGGKGVATTDGQMNPSFDMMTAELDK